MELSEEDVSTIKKIYEGKIKKHYKFNSVANAFVSFEYMYSRPVDITNINDRYNMAILLTAFKIRNKDEDSLEYLRRASNQDILNTIPILERITQKSFVDKINDSIKSRIITITPFGDYIYESIFNEDPREEGYITEEQIKKIADRERTFLESFLEITPKNLLTKNADKKLHDIILLANLRDKFNEESNKNDNSNDERSLNEKIEASLKKIEQAINDIENVEKAKFEQKEKRKQENVKIFIESLSAIGSEIEKIGKYSGKQDIATIGSVIGSAVVLADAASKLGFISATSSSAATGWAVLTPAGAGIAALAAIYVAISSKSSNGISKSFGAIQKQIDDFQKNVNEQFFQVGKKLDALKELIVDVSQHISDKLEIMLDFERFGVNENVKLTKASMFVGISDIETKVALEALPFNAEGLHKDLSLLTTFAVTISKGESFNGCNLDSSKLDNGFTQNQLGNRYSPVDNISFYVDYAKEILKIEDLPNGTDVPNFDLFYKMLQTFLTLVSLAIKNDSRCTKSTEILVNEHNANFILNTLAKLNTENDKIGNIVKIVRDKVLPELMRLYKEEITKISKYIEEEVVKYSDDRKIPYIFYTFDTLQTHFKDIIDVNTRETDYFRAAGRNRGNGNTWPEVKCKVTKGECVPGLFVFATQLGVASIGRASTYDGENRKINDYKIAKVDNDWNYYDQNCKSRSAECDYHISLRLGGHRKLSLYDTANDKIKAKLKNLREEVSLQIREKAEFKSHLQEIITYEKFLSVFSFITGYELKLDSTTHINNYLDEVKTISLDKNVTTLTDSITSTFEAIDEAYKKWEASPNRYQSYQEAFFQLINMNSNLIEIQQQHYDNRKEATIHDIQEEKATPEELFIKKKASFDQDKIDKIYLKLKALFYGILKQAENIKISLEGNPEILDEFNKLLENVHIEETLTLNPVPNGITLEVLSIYKCEVYCLDRYAQCYNEGYRAFMKNDQNMEYIIDVIQKFSGEIQPCDCMIFYNK